MKWSPWVVALGMSSLLLIAAMILATASPIAIGDTGIYRQYALQMSHGAWPYRDFQLEYLPGVIPFIFLALGLGRVAGDYTLGYLILTIVAVGTMLWDVYRTWGKRQLLQLSGIFLLFGTYIFYELDIFSALALYGALRCCKIGRYNWSAVLLGATVLFKAYPIICLPLLLLAIPRPLVRRYIGVVAAVIVGGLAPFIIASPVGLWHAVTYHTGRPLQIESGPAAVGFILHLFGEPLRAYISHKSTALTFPSAQLLNGLSSLILFVGILWGIGFAYFAGRVRHDHAKIATGCALLLMIFILFFKVGSPQYLLLPICLLPFIEGEVGRQLTNQLWICFAAIGAACLTLLESSYAWHVSPQWYGGMLVVARFGLEIVAVILLARALRRPSVALSLGKHDSIHPARPSR